MQYKVRQRYADPQIDRDRQILRFTHSQTLEKRDIQANNKIESTNESMYECVSERHSE